MSENRKSDLIYLLGLLRSIQKIYKMSAHLSSANDLIEEEDLIIANACFMQFTCLGENAKKIDYETRLLYTNIPWSEIIGFRNNIVHEYQDIDLIKVFSIIKDDLPTLEENIYTILSLELKAGRIPQEHYDVAKNSDYYQHIDFSRIKLD